MTQSKKSKRGFASMPVAQRTRIASLGGKAAHAQGTAHEFTHDEAVRAGKLGGGSSRKNHISRPALRRAA